MSDAEPFVLSEVDGAVGRLTLNEPARLNPVTGTGSRSSGPCLPCASRCWPW
jgi:hypothetical protein